MSFAASSCLREDQSSLPGWFSSSLALLQLCVGRRCLIFQLLHGSAIISSIEALSRSDMDRLRPIFVGHRRRLRSASRSRILLRPSPPRRIRRPGPPLLRLRPDCPKDPVLWAASAPAPTDPLVRLPPPRLGIRLPLSSATPAPPLLGSMALSWILGAASLLCCFEEALVVLLSPVGGEHLICIWCRVKGARS